MSCLHVGNPTVFSSTYLSIVSAGESCIDDDDVGWCGVGGWL